MNKFFIEGFCKTAAPSSNEEKHYVRRFFLGNPISGAIKAKSGKKWKTFKDTWLHMLVQSLKGGVGGAGAGALIGALKGVRSGKINPLMVKRLALGGANLGGTVGKIYGTFDEKATQLHNKYAK